MKSCVPGRGVGHAAAAAVDAVAADDLLIPPRCERRTGSSQGIPRWEHRRQAGTAASQRRLALMQAAHDFCREGGLLRSRAVMDIVDGG